MPSQPPISCADHLHAAPPTADEFPIRICVLDDHPIIGAHLQMSLRPFPDLQVVSVSKKVTDTQRYLAEHPCDLIVLDFLLPGERDDGGALIKRLRRRHPYMAIVVLSAGNTQHVRHTAFKCGANAHIAKGEMLGNLPALLRQACHHPEAFFYLEEGQILTGAPELTDEELTLCEIEVLRQIAHGYSVGKLAEKMKRSKKTISSHKRRAMAKLGIADDVGLALYLQEHRDSLA